jgi:hypothetical protein
MPLVSGEVVSEAESSTVRPHAFVRVPCRSVLYRKTAKSVLFRTVLFRMNLEQRWCWKGARIVEASATCYSTDVDVAVQADRCGKPQGQYLATPYDFRGGWHSIAENTYRNCLPGPGGSWTCWRQSTVTLQIRAYAGGGWTGQGGDR